MRPCNEWIYSITPGCHPEAKPKDPQDAPASVLGGSFVAALRQDDITIGQYIDRHEVDEAAMSRQGFNRFGPTPMGIALLAFSLLLLLAPPADALTITRERTLMHTTVRIVLCGENAAALEAAADAAFAEIGRIETLMAPRGAGSGIAEVNRRAGAEPVVVAPELFALIEASLAISNLSGGAFDITFPPLGRLWNLESPRIRVPSSTEVEPLRRLVDFRKVRLHEEGRTVSFDTAGMEIALGGIAKGYAVDRATGVIRSRKLTGGIVDAGGDLRAFGRKEDGGLWTVGVKNPRARETLIGVVPISDAAVATSGDYERFRIVDGVRFHHILDPRTGYPAEECMSVTVVTAKAYEADALATAVFVLGPSEGMALLERLPGTEGLIVDAGGRVTVSTGLKMKRD